jgi:hypothetical protein
MDSHTKTPYEKVVRLLRNHINLTRSQTYMTEELLNLIIERENPIILDQRHHTMRLSARMPAICSMLYEVEEFNRNGEYGDTPVYVRRERAPKKMRILL